MVSLLGKPTTYEINRQVGYTVGQFWSFPASQLYAETARLAAAGLLDEQREQGGRHRRYYTITDHGRQALGDWLGDPTSPPPSCATPDCSSCSSASWPPPRNWSPLPKPNRPGTASSSSPTRPSWTATATGPSWPAGWPPRT